MLDVGSIVLQDDTGQKKVWQIERLFVRRFSIDGQFGRSILISDSVDL